MPQEFFDAAEMALHCPTCGRTTQKTIAWLKANCHYVCPGCWRFIRHDRKKFIASFVAVDLAVAELLHGVSGDETS